VPLILNSGKRQSQAAVGGAVRGSGRQTTAMACGRTRRRKEMNGGFCLIQLNRGNTVLYENTPSASGPSFAGDVDQGMDVLYQEL